MKKISILAASLILVTGLCACSSENTSTTEFNVSTTTDGNTTSYSYTSETVDGETTVTETINGEPVTTENTQESGNDIDVRYYADQGMAYIMTTINNEAVEVTAMDFEDSTLVQDAWMEGNVFTVEYEADMQDGEGYAILHVSPNGAEDASSYIILPVYVQNGAIYDVADDFTVVDSLDQYFTI